MKIPKSTSSKFSLQGLRVPRMNEVIIAGISLANGVRLAWAYSYADAAGNLQSAPGLAGLLLGGSISLGTAYVSGAVARLLIESEPPVIEDGAKPTAPERAAIRKSKTAAARAQIAIVGLAGLLVLEPVILAPLSITDMPTTLAANLPAPWNWIWSVTLAIAPSLALAAVAVAEPPVRASAPAHAQGATAPANTSATAQSGKKGSASALQKSGGGKKSPLPEKICTEPNCGMTYRSWPAHYKAHHLPTAIQLPAKTTGGNP
jgi:hypothetical protein